MKTVFKRMLCIVVALCICCATIPQIFGVMANETEPQLSSRCETIIELNGKDTTFGSSASSLRINTRIKFGSAMDFSAVDEIELSVYVESISALAEHLTESNRFNLFFSSHSRYETSKCSYADISEQIKRNGWNTVNIKKSDFAGDCNWSSVRFIYLGFTDEDITISSKLANKVVKYKNVCDLFAIPEISDGDIVIFDNAVIDTLGDSEASLVSDISSRFTSAFDTKDISTADIIKADFCISNYSAYTAFINNYPIKISLLSENGELYTKDILAYYPTDTAGWYTVQFAVSKMNSQGNFDINAVNGIKVEFIADDGITLGDSYSLTFGIANLRGLKYELPEADNTYGGSPTDIGVERITTAVASDYFSMESGISGDFSALKDSEYFEFDLYVNDAVTFRNAFINDGESNSINASYNLILSASGKTLTFKDVEKQVVSNGWNHIILPISSAENSGFKFNENLNNICFIVSGIDNALKNPIKGEFVFADNFIATKGTAAKGELKFNKLTVITDGKSGKIGGTFEGSVVSDKISVLDITGSKYIEFDIYVQNFQTFKAEITKKGITDISLRFSSTEGSDYSVNSVTANVLGKISQNGWNHIVIPFSKFTKGSTTGEFDITKVSAWSFVFEGALNESSALLAGQLIKISNITAVDVIDPQMPNDALAIISKEGKSGVYGESYSSIDENSLIALDSPVDATVASKLEFDFYVEDYDAFKKMIESSANPIYLALGTSEEKSKGRALYQFTNQITGDGWNHIELNVDSFTKSTGDIEPNLETVYYAFLTFAGKNTTNAYDNLPFNIKNICIIPAVIDRVPTAPEYEVEMWMDGVTTTWGTNYGWAFSRTQKKFTNTPIDLSGVSQIEFDIYIEDVDAFWEAHNTGHMYLYIGSDDNVYKNRYYYYFTNLTNQITTDGWSHVIVELANRSWADGTLDFTNVKYVAIGYNEAPNVANPIANTVVRIANMGANDALYDRIPALPDNVLAQVGSSEKGTDTAGTTVGAYFHYTLDRIFKSKLDPVDLSQTPIIEFDVYISDYDKFLAAENDPTDGMNSKLAFAISSTAPELWGQYSKSYCYFNSQINLADYVTHSGWNHVVVGQAEFEKYNHGVDWSGITGYMVYYRNSTNFAPFVNTNGDLYVKVANIVNTGVIANIPEDKPADIKPDKSAVYISSIEGTADENGAWNVSDVIVSEKYKTAGIASLHKKITYKSKIEETIMGYIFDTTADFSDLKTLKFDFFVDLPQHLIKPTNKIEIIIGNNRFGKEDYFSWYMELTNIKQGWNEISLDFQDAKAVGNPDLKKAKLVMFRFTELDLSAENFEELVYGIDNLRYLSSTGNTVLRVEGWDNTIEQEKDNNLNIEQETDNDLNIGQDAIENEDVSEKVETVVNKTGKVKYNKIVERTIITDWLYAGIIVGAVAVVCSAGVILFVIIHRKRNKKV